MSGFGKGRLFVELRQIATASADGSQKPAIECHSLAGQCEGIGGCGHAPVRGPREGINPIAAQIPIWRVVPGGRMSEMLPRMKTAVFQLTNGSRVCGCGRAERRWDLALEHQH
jgi:hypothetical protein